MGVGEAGEGTGSLADRLDATRWRIDLPGVDVGELGDAVAALLPLHPEQAQPSANKETLVRLRLNLALGSGAPPCDLAAIRMQ